MDVDGSVVFELFGDVVRGLGYYFVKGVFVSDVFDVCVGDLVVCEVDGCFVVCFC